MAKTNWKHRGTGLPSKGWLMSRLEKYRGQRIEFVLIPQKDNWTLLNSRLGYDLNKPIVVNGIFSWVWYEVNFFSWGNSRVSDVFIELRGVVFKQNEKTGMLINPSYERYNKHHRMRFNITEISGLNFLEKFKEWTPKLEYKNDKIEEGH